MGLYVEVMCDERDCMRVDDCGRLICWSHSNDNPQGCSVRAARAEAKAQGWKRDICPACQAVT
jgi:hypothetical protein